MRGRISFHVEAADQAELDRLRDSVDLPCAVISADATIEDNEFTVLGSVRGNPDATWSETVYAADRDEAETKALATDSTRTVVAVLRGSIQSV